MPPRTPVLFFNNKTAVMIVALILIAAAFWFGQTNGYTKGYAQAQADAQALQEEAARKAAEEAAKAANPFQAVNPMEGVEANPFEKVKKVLNPFEK